MIDNSKERYLQFRDRARELYARCAVMHGEQFGTNIILEDVSIPLHANVQIGEGGAFVEAIVWVPNEKFDRPVAAVVDDTRDAGPMGVEEHREVMRAIMDYDD